MYYTIFSSMLASIHTQTKNVSGYCQMSPGGQKPSQVENHWCKLTVSYSSNFTPYYLSHCQKKLSCKTIHYWTKILKKTGQKPSISPYFHNIPANSKTKQITKLELREVQ